jgi:hypothetical protein
MIHTIRFEYLDGTYVNIAIKTMYPKFIVKYRINQYLAVKDKWTSGKIQDVPVSIVKCTMQKDYYRNAIKFIKDSFEYAWTDDDTMIHMTVILFDRAAVTMDMIRGKTNEELHTLLQEVNKPKKRFFIF